MTEYYFLNSHNQPQGPHSLDELASMMASGRVNPTTLIACKGAASWEPLGSVLSRENINAPEISLTPSQVGHCPSCRHDLTADLSDNQLPARCPICRRALRPAKRGIWANYALAIRNYFNFSGRATRAEYWCFQLVNFLIAIVLYIGLISSLVSSLLFTNNQGVLETLSEEGTAPASQLADCVMNGAPSWALPVFFISAAGLVLFGLFLFIPSICVSIRRLHDVGWSGWWIGGSFLLSIIYSIVSAVAKAALETEGSADNILAIGSILSLLFLIISYGYSIFLFVLTLLDSQRGPNAYGPSSKYPLG